MLLESVAIRSVSYFNPPGAKQIELMPEITLRDFG